MNDSGGSSTTAIALSVGVIAVTVGYFIGQGSTLGLFNSSSSQSRHSRKAKSWPNSYDVTIHPDSSDEELMARQKSEETDDSSDEDSLLEEFNSFSDSTEEVKLVLAVRTDLGMGKGKIAAQCSHATLTCYKSLLRHPPSTKLLRRWESGGQPKIAVQIKSDEEMMVLLANAYSLGLCAKIIHDAGRTQIAAGSATVLGILGPKSVVDQVTGHLKLL